MILITLICVAGLYLPAKQSFYVEMFEAIRDKRLHEPCQAGNRAALSVSFCAPQVTCISV